VVPILKNKIPSEQLDGDAFSRVKELITKASLEVTSWAERWIRRIETGNDTLDYECFDIKNAQSLLRPLCQLLEQCHKDARKEGKELVAQFLRVIASKEARPNYQAAITLAFWNGFSVKSENIPLFNDLIQLVLNLNIHVSVSMHLEIDALSIEFKSTPEEQVLQNLCHKLRNQTQRVKAITPLGDDLFNIEYFFDNPPPANTNPFLLLTQPFLPNLKGFAPPQMLNDAGVEDAENQDLEQPNIFHLSNIENTSTSSRPIESQVPEFFSTLTKNDPPPVILCEELLYVSKKKPAKPFYPHYGVLTLKPLGELHLICLKRNIFKLVSAEEVKASKLPKVSLFAF
jgi:hypothetical protein